MNQLPEFIIIGGMKCGTTSLYRYLDSHPRISGSKLKEPSFFSDINWNKGLDWYRKQFRNDQTIKFEASTIYSKYPQHKHIAERMARVVPTCRLIYVVRHPVDRLISQIKHNLMTGNLDSVKIDSEEFWCNEMVHYLNCSRYHLQISQYLPYYPKSVILVVRAEDLSVKPALVLRSIAEFIEISSDGFGSDILRKSFNASEKRGKIVFPLLYRGLKKLHADGVIPEWHTGLVRPMEINPYITSAEFRKRVWEQTMEDLVRFENEMNISLDYSSPRKRELANG